ncbi:MAG: 4-(cytidine 5'-diphospho)-2-C-methyl-D-erythritol kinase [Thermodesulforhabdaceae bacterium]
MYPAENQNRRILCPAKINLWLQVTGKRSDGYHDLWTLMLPVDVFDEMEISWSDTPEVEIVNEGFRIPRDRTNIIWKAYNVYRKHTGWPSRGVKVKIQKNIPAGAGLGGGSSNGAAMLKFLNTSNPSPCSIEELRHIARDVGADVPFFIEAIPAVASGIGDKLSGVYGIPSYPVLLIKPPFEVSTKTIYKSLKLTEKKALISIDALLDAPWRLTGMLQNDLEEVTMSLYPEVRDIKEWLRREGALEAMMSGSGPTVFGLFDSREKAEAVLEAAMERWGSSYWMRVCRVLSQQDKKI